MRERLAEDFAHENIVVTTGGSRGIGRGLIEATAEMAYYERESIALGAWRDQAGGVEDFSSAYQVPFIEENLGIINLGNASRADVTGRIKERGKEKMFPRIIGMSSIDFVGGVDFRKPGALREAFEKRVFDMRRENGHRIIQVVYAAGVAPMDGDENVDDVDAVNTRAAVELAEAVRDSGLAIEDANFLYVSSLAADPDGRRVPGLGRYTESKWAGIQGVRDVWTAGENCKRKVSVLLPGVFDSDMADEVMKSEKAPLEFFAAPLASTDPENPMMVAVAKAILNGEMPDEMKFPRLSRWYVKLASVERQQTLLPLLVKVFAKSVLQAKGQTAEDHDRRIAYHKDHATYGDNFPYDELLYKNLWNGSIGKNMERALKFLGIV